LPKKRADVDLGILRNDDAGIEPGIAFAIARLSRNRDRAGSDCGGKGCLAKMAEAVGHWVLHRLEERPIGTARPPSDWPARQVIGGSAATAV
jgi:hypothetical protein